MASKDEKKLLSDLKSYDYRNHTKLLSIENFYNLFGGIALISIAVYFGIVFQIPNQFSENLQFALIIIQKVLMTASIGFSAYTFFYLPSKRRYLERKEYRELEIFKSTLEVKIEEKLSTLDTYNEKSNNKQMTLFQ